jgi:signal transduction histidine kinase
VRPLDPLSSIKFKLGVVIVAAVGVTVLVQAVGLRTGLPLWAVGLASGALALGMVQLLARGMTSPLREMVSATGAMARGDYSRRVTATSRDEVGELARAFNTMAAELAEIDRLRRDLVANVSHELRTPISALQAVLENLVDGVEPPDPDTLRTMLAQVQRLGRLVEQLLDLSRLESGAVPLERRLFEIGPLLEQAAEESRVHAERGMVRNVRLSVDVEPASLRLDGDPERVHQVVANLLENAIRY